MKPYNVGMSFLDKDGQELAHISGIVPVPAIGSYITVDGSELGWVDGIKYYYGHTQEQWELIVGITVTIRKSK